MLLLGEFPLAYLASELEKLQITNVPQTLRASEALNYEPVLCPDGDDLISPQIFSRLLPFNSKFQLHSFLTSQRREESPCTQGLQSELEKCLIISDKLKREKYAAEE